MQVDETVDETVDELTNRVDESEEKAQMDDLISKEQIKNAYTEWYGKYADSVFLKIIRDLPPVTPQQKTGHWIKTISENGITSAVRCSECGFEDNRYMLFRYCPNCGAKMAEGEG
jgi:hypothetical protein